MIIVAASLVLLFVLRWFQSAASTWRRNYRLAQTTGFPTFISPIHIFDAWWMILYPVLLPIISKLPDAWTRTWLSIAQTWKLWKSGYLPFQQAGADTFMLSTPKGNILWTCDHSVVHDLLTQHPNVDIPVDMMGFYDVWGPTIGSVDGEEWRAHRKVLSTGFGNAMNLQVWKEAQKQTQSLVSRLAAKEHSTVNVMRDWTSKLALHVISCASFGMHLDWDEPESFRKESLTFHQAIVLLLKRLSTVFVTPRQLLHILPFTMFREASLAISETERYIVQQRAAAEAGIEIISKKRNTSILEAIVISGRDPEMVNRSPFLERHVLGNLFFTLMAGHETVGSSLGFLFILVTLYPDVQRKIQLQLDTQLGTRRVEQWTLEHDYPALMSGYIGAVQREILSIYHPASFMLRRIKEPIVVTDSDGVAYNVPGNTLAFPNLSAVSKNPKLWRKPDVSQARRDSLSDSPALYFNPERWLDGDGNLVKETNPDRHADGRQVPTWWAFGQGPRACPGKAFAQIEMTAAVAVLFKNHSLELIVSEHTLTECGSDAAAAWEKTRDEGIKMLYDDIEANMTISLPRELPIRVVDR